MKVFSLLFVLLGVVCGVKQSKVVLKNSGYEGVVVALQDDIPVNLCQEILIGLQESLQAASFSISAATRNWASLRTVTVLVPRSWTPSLCPHILGITDAKSESYDTADLRITNSQDPKHGVEPWTQQSEGCGSMGDYISVSHHLFRQNSTNINGRLLANQWLRYRYGVFEEAGEAGNPLHPPRYRAPDASFKPNVCADKTIVESPACDPEKVGCDLNILQEENPSLSSSFMALPTLPSVTDLCDESTHDKFAPTRHNLACEGKSVWEVLKQSKDFQDSRLVKLIGRTLYIGNSDGKVVDSLVSLRYVYPQRERIVLLVDDTNVMNSQKRWDFMRKAVRKVVAYDIPEAFSVGLVVFDSRVKVKHNLSPLTDSDIREKVGSSLPRNPSSVGEHKRCVLCGIETSLRLLKKNGGVGGSIILVTGGSSTMSEADKRKANALLAEAGVSLNTIFYPLIDRFPNPGNTLEYLTAVTGGKSFIVPDEGIGEDSRVGMYYALLDALYNSIGNVAGWKGLPVKIHEAEHPGGLSLKSEGSFLVDPSLSSNINFAIYYYDVGHVGNAVHLISPHNQEIDTSNMQSEDGNMNMVRVQLSGSQVTPGLWRYSVDNKADSHQGLFIQVTSTSYSTAGQSSKVEVRGWSNHPTGIVNASDTSKPLSLFAEVRSGGSAVEGAKVTANLTRLGLTTNGTLHKPQEIVLLDNGFMGPDMLQGDGVYSRSIPSLTTGKFKVTIRVEGNIGQYKFIRHLRLGILNVISSTPVIDALPPSRIVDLRMTVLPEASRKVSFTWTAPGNDFDFGVADGYIVKMAPTPDFDSSDVSIIANWPSPLPASSIQQHTLDWDVYNLVRYVSIQAVDKNGNRSPMSNAVSVFVTPPPTTTPEPSFFNVIRTASISDNAVDDQSASSFIHGYYMWLIIGAIVLAVFLLSCVALAIVNRQKSSKSKKTTDIPTTFAPNIAGQNEKSFSSDRTDSKESIKKEFISPVESWSASQLLGGHQDGKNQDNLSARSDDNSDHSDSTKKSYTGFSATNDFYGNPAHYQYNAAMYPESYHPPSESYPTPTEGYGMHPEVYPVEGFMPPLENRPYMSNPPSESFLSVSCDLLPNHGPPGYSAYPGYDNTATLRAGGKVPPPIPPKPKVMFNPEPFQYEGQEVPSSESPSLNGAEKRVRNVTMV